MEKFSDTVFKPRSHLLMRWQRPEAEGPCETWANRCGDDASRQSIPKGPLATPVNGQPLGEEE